MVTGNRFLQIIPSQERVTGYSEVSTRRWLGCLDGFGIGSRLLEKPVP